MTTRIPRLLVMGALLTPSTLCALGLGEIRLNSALNQQFDAEIELVAPTRDELTSLKVGLANADTFERFGLDRPAFLSDFRFRVTRSERGGNVIRVTSPDRITEPFLTFIVEAGWGGGRLLREYTVLLDPPVYMPPGAEESAPVATPRSGAQAEGVIERPRQAAPRPAAQPASSSAPAAYAGGTYTVQRNDTLWRIASQIRPGSPRVVNQTMIALYRANPEAFDGNINLLRSGAVLRIPEAGAIDQVGAGEASREVAAQYEAWRGERGAGDSERLRLVAPEESSAAPSPRVAQRADAGSAAAEAELRSRVATLESELADARRLLEVRNAELAQLQRRLAEAGTEAAIEPQPLLPEAGAPAEPIEEAVPETEPEVVATEPAPTVAAQPAAEPARPAARPPAVVREPEPTLLQRLGEYWWGLVVLGLALLAGLLLYFRKRREPDIDEAIETLTPSEFGSRATRVAAARARPEPVRVEETPATTTTELEPPVPLASRRAARTGAAAAGIGAATAKIPDDTISSETAISFDQQDALAEADFHMAYGLYDQAADLVKIAIEREPARRDLKLKLLEIYFVWGNKDLFLETARDLEASRHQAEPGEWDKVLIMGKQICPDEPMFAGAVAGGHGSDLVDLNLEGGENRVDVDLFGEPDETGGTAALDFDIGGATTDSAARSNDESGIDFLLDEPQRGGGDYDYDADTSARTQETPTVESPALDDSQRDRANVGGETVESRRPAVEQTAEIAIDDLGIEVDPYADTDAHGAEDDDVDEAAELLGDSEDSADESLSGTGTVLLDDDNLISAAETAEHPQIDPDESAVDFDLGEFVDDDDDSRTVEHTAEWATAGLRDTAATESEFDLSDTRSSPELGGTRTMETPDLSELEPVTMSEVGTKLDLARAYVDMGDPDGARSILEEVLQEGSNTQKQEAQRLLESIV